MGGYAVNAASIVDFVQYYYARHFVECITVEWVDEFCCLATEHRSTIVFIAPDLCTFAFSLSSPRSISAIRNIFWRSEKLVFTAILDLCIFVPSSENFSRRCFWFLSSRVSRLKRKQSSFNIRGVKYLEQSWLVTWVKKTTFMQQRTNSHHKTKLTDSASQRSFYCFIFASKFEHQCQSSVNNSLLNRGLQLSMDAGEYMWLFFASVF